MGEGEGKDAKLISKGREKEREREVRYELSATGVEFRAPREIERELRCELSAKASSFVLRGK